MNDKLVLIEPFETDPDKRSVWLCLPRLPVVFLGNADSQADAELLAEVWRAALRECGETEQQTDVGIDYCTTHRAVFKAGYGNCTRAMPAGDDCKPVPLFFRAPQGQQQ